MTGLTFRDDELIVDNFAGGGGASVGIEKALGRPVDIAINHDPEALAMHAANHPQTRHLCENVWKVDIAAEVAGRSVGLAWFSPDCTHFSKAKGGKPVKKRIRGLAWVALKWAGLVRPRVIFLENVEEFQDWGPLVDGRPCPRRKGMTFKRWCTQLRTIGYRVDWREMRACDYGAPTIRKRLFIVARCDGAPITWPESTHGPEGDLFLEPYKTAAECITWSLPCHSIFLTKEEGRKVGVNRPLAPATMRRIARGVKRYVLDSAAPFIVNLTHHGSDRNESLMEPFRTVTGARRGEKALVTPFLSRQFGNSVGSPMAAPAGTTTAGGGGKTALVVPFLGTYYGANREGGERLADPNEPLRTQSTENRFSLVAAFLAQHNAGPHNENMSGRHAGAPISTITASGTQQQIVTSHLLKLRGTSKDGQPVDTPLHTVSAGGTHLGEVRAFLMKYYSTDQDPRLTEPLHSVTTKDRFGLVTVHGEDYVIADIGMRMLTPRELFRAQGFPEDYVIDRGIDVATGEVIRLTKTAQIRMCGNSVSPHPAMAIVRAQFGGEPMQEAA